jgi:hypothetical protein
MKLQDKADFLTLIDAKNYLKVEHDLDDAFITDLIEIAKEQADHYLQNEFEDLNDAGELVDQPIPFSCKLACLKMIASWYETRSDDITGINAGGVTISLGEIPWNAIRLLQPYRRLVGL